MTNISLKQAFALAGRQPMHAVSRQNEGWAWALLPARTILFAAWQTLFALGFLLSGSHAAWDTSAAWWPFAVALSNVVCIVALAHLYRREGLRYWGLFRIQCQHFRRDLLALVGILVISVPVASLPNTLCASWLFQDTRTPIALLFRPLPLWAIWAALVVFPVTQGLAEIPTYMAYVMPRLEARTGRRWLSLALPAFFLGAQHVAAPLLLNGRFIIWRLMMFLPFAFLVALVMRWRPRLLPYLAVVHIGMDLSAAAMLFSA
jgi:hypothetical protein